MKIYHGSKNEFKEFDSNLIRSNATDEGVGFYCTDNLGVASSYGDQGYVMEYEYIGKKRLSSEKITITLKDLTEFIIKLNEEDEFLSNYGDTAWEGFEKVLKRALNSLLENNKDDVELISEICNTDGGFESPLKLLYEVLGYDSSIVNAKWGNQKIYLIFHNSAIKYIRSWNCKVEESAI